MRDIKKVGTSEATVHFHKEVEVKIPVTVVAENQQNPVAAEEKSEELVADTASDTVADKK